MIFRAVLPVILSSLTLSALPTISSPTEISQLFPRDVSDITRLTNKTEIRYSVLLEEIITTPSQKRSFDTVFAKWDEMESEYLYATNLLDTIAMCSPDEAMRKSASKAQQRITKMRVSILFEHPEFYDVLSSTSYDGMDEGQQYYFDQVKAKLKKEGFHLSGNTRTELKNLLSDAYAKGKKFVNNISEDSRHITSTSEELKGISPRLLSNLTLTKDGKYILTTDYPVIFPILMSCSVESTRKALSDVFTNRAHPHNQKVLETLISLRSDIADKVGFDSFSEMEIKTEMAKTPDRAGNFIHDLAQKIAPKAAQEAATLTKLLPKEVQLSKDGRFNEWDVAYIIEQAKQQLFQLSSEEVSEYFPLEKTIQGLIGVYEAFFDVSIKELPLHEMWADDVRLLEVTENGNGFIHGYVLLDLHPRPNKYSHACMVPLLPAYDSKIGSPPATALLICNFPRESKDAPALLTHRNVITFFHEFGHGLHHLFGRPTLASASLDAVPADFVELPSQLLEEWMWEPEILKKVSSHYKTGLSLPDALITKMVDARNFAIGLQTQRQCALSLVSLSLFSSSRVGDPNELYRSIFNEQSPHISVSPQSHAIMSFGHLSGYGSRYYGYLWSRVIAADIFETIKSEGLLNKKVGTRYRDDILRPAATRDPNEMVSDFLGRDPQQEALLRRIGV